MRPVIEANLMMGPFKRCGVVKLPQLWGLPPVIIHVEPDGRQGVFKLNENKPPLMVRGADLAVERVVYDYRQVKTGDSNGDAGPVRDCDGADDVLLQHERR